MDHIKRQKVKGTMIKSAASPETEPDFYSMSFVAVTSNPAALAFTPSEDVSRFDFLKAQRATSPCPPVSSAAHVSTVAENLPKPKANIFEQSLVSNSDLDELSFEGKTFHYLSASQSNIISEILLLSFLQASI